MTGTGIGKSLSIKCSIIVWAALATASFGADALLVPMDIAQSDFCRSYGLVWQALDRKASDVFWALNYRGGSFILPDDPSIRRQAAAAKVYLEPLAKTDFDAILTTAQEENMDVVPLETAPRIGIYLASEGEKGSDVVAQLLDHVGIKYQVIYDDGILDGKLSDIDWLHIHHKDFTGQGHKRGYDAQDANLASARGFAKVWQMKQAVSTKIRDFVAGGGFLFAMCSAAETLDISLAADGNDIVDTPFDGDPPVDDPTGALNYARSLAFGGFTVFADATHEYSDIDVPEAGAGTIFSLFEFSAQVDAIPCLLNQNHNREIHGFSGETSSFRKSLVKKDVTILAENNDGVSVRYLMGTLGKGVYCYYGGHTPGENFRDYQTNAAGFRLILNNVLFPSAKTRRRKT
ncbi:asparagine synthetase B [Candidatus Ozemobacteraceae bacterium]|nr:asparagine synthetase B [Candidatus Ozemobacteraceae bacterium]